MQRVLLHCGIRHGWIVRLEWELRTGKLEWRVPPKRVELRLFARGVSRCYVFLANTDAQNYLHGIFVLWIWRAAKCSANGAKRIGGESGRQTCRSIHVQQRSPGGTALCSNRLPDFQSLRADNSQAA